MDHEDLVQELSLVEKLTVEERVQLAKLRRKEQVRDYERWILSEPNCHLENAKEIKIKYAPQIQLMESVTNGNIKELKKILNEGVDPNVPSFDGLTALHHSCIEGYSDIVNLLLLKGANVNAIDSDGWTPLHAASTCGHKEIVELLVRTGGNLLAMNYDGDMPYQITDDEDTLYFLEIEMSKQGITQEVTNKLRQAPQSLLKRDIYDAIKIGGDLDNPVTVDGATFLHVAIAHFYNELVKVLIENGASDIVEDHEGWRPVHVAAYWENKSAIDLLINERNTDLTSQTITGEKPHELCDDPSLKIYIIRIMNHHNITDEVDGKSFAPKMTIDEDSELDTSDESSDDNSDVNVKNTNVIDTDVKVNPLYNPDANESVSNTKSPVKEAKKQAPLIRSQSYERLLSFQENLDKINIKYQEENSSESESNGHDKLRRINVIQLATPLSNNTTCSSNDESDNSSSFISAVESPLSNSRSIIQTSDDDISDREPVLLNIQNIPKEDELLEIGDNADEKNYVSSNTRNIDLENSNISSVQDRNVSSVIEKERKRSTPEIAIISSESNSIRNHNEKDIISDIAWSILDPSDIKIIAEQLEQEKCDTHLHSLNTMTEAELDKNCNSVTNQTNQVLPIKETTKEKNPERREENSAKGEEENSAKGEEEYEDMSKKEKHLKTLSEGSLYTLKWQRMKDREKNIRNEVLSKELDRNSITLPDININVQSDNKLFDHIPEYKYHFKQLEYESETKSTLFTKSRKCNIM